MTTARETAAEKKAREAKEAEDAKAAAAKNEKSDSDNAVETTAKRADSNAPGNRTGADEEVEYSDPNRNDRREVRTADTGIAEPEGSFPFRPTATDANGIERILPAADPNWEPAPLEASEADIAAAKKREEAAEEYATARKEGRIDQISGRMLSKSEKREQDKEAKA